MVFGVNALNDVGLLNVSDSVVGMVLLIGMFLLILIVVVCLGLRLFVVLIENQWNVVLWLMCSVLLGSWNSVVL